LLPAIWRDPLKKESHTSPPTSNKDKREATLRIKLFYAGSKRE